MRSIDIYIINFYPKLLSTIMTVSIAIDIIRPRYSLSGTGSCYNKVQEETLV